MPWFWLTNSGAIPYNYFENNGVSTISYSYEVRKKVKEDFEEKRKKAFELSESRKSEVYAKVEGIRELDEALSKTGLKVYAEALNKSTDIPLEDRIAVLREENEELQKARAQLLTAAGYAPDYTKPKFDCPKCSDTGYVDLDPCECLIKALRKESYLSSGLGSILSDQSFRNFDISLYPERSRDMMKYVYESVKKFAEDFGKKPGADKNLMFYGGTGLGKTHLSTALAKRIIDRGYYVIYDTALNIMHNFERERFSKVGSPVSTDRYFECDLLIIDDLGSEFSNSFTHATLYNILNTRLYSDKGTVISTNLSNAELAKNYDERIVSRVFGSFRTFGFEGDDIRMLTRQNKLKKKNKE